MGNENLILDLLQ